MLTSLSKWLTAMAGAKWAVASLLKERNEFVDDWGLIPLQVGWFDGMDESNGAENTRLDMIP